MTIKNEALELEKVCQVHKLFVHEYQVGCENRQLPVITEHAQKYDFSTQTKVSEFYRARAYHGNGKSFRDFDPYANSISVTICHRTKLIMFGPFGLISMNPKGVRLGPALMGNVVEWLQRQRDLDDYIIQSGMLSDSDAKTDIDRIQRNKFYMAFGFEVSSVTGVNGVDVSNGSFTSPGVGHLSIPERYASRLTPWGTFDAKVEKERFSAIANSKLLTKARAWYKAGFFTRNKWPL